MAPAAMCGWSCRPTRSALTDLGPREEPVSPAPGGYKARELLWRPCGFDDLRCCRMAGRHVRGRTPGEALPVS